MSRAVVLLTIVGLSRAGAQAPPFQVTPPRSALALGASASSGVVGVEYLYLPFGGFGVGLGAGAAGFGGRVLYAAREQTFPFGGQVRRYFDVGYVSTPWRFGNIDAKGALLAEGGYQLWTAGPTGGLFADLGGGLAFVNKGTWGGNEIGVTWRLLVGWAR